MPPMPVETVLIGDMNFTYDSPEHEAIVGSMTPANGRIINLGGLANAYVLAGHDGQEGYSVPER